MACSQQNVPARLLAVVMYNYMVLNSHLVHKINYDVTKVLLGDVAVEV